jgi:hypothetical protein
MDITQPPLKGKGFKIGPVEEAGAFTQIGPEFRQRIGLRHNQVSLEMSGLRGMEHYLA